MLINCYKPCQGIIVPGGFGDRGVEGKIIAAQWAPLITFPI